TPAGPAGRSAAVASPAAVPADARVRRLVRRREVDVHPGRGDRGVEAERPDDALHDEPPHRLVLEVERVAERGEEDALLAAVLPRHSPRPGDRLRAWIARRVGEF